MIVRSTHAAQLIPKAGVVSAGRQTRQCSIYPVHEVLRSTHSLTCKRRISVQVAAQRVVYAGQAQPRFAKQLGLLKKDDMAQEASSVDNDKPPQPRFAKQLGLLKEDKHDEQQEEQPEVDQIDVEESATEPSSSQLEQYEPDLQEEQLEVEQIGADESELEPSTSQPEQGKATHHSLYQCCCCYPLAVSP